MRHYRIMRQQVHELELNQRLLQRNFNEMQNHKFADRVRNLEIEQKRMANSNFNLSRQVSDFDKLHTSLLELLEDVEDIETKIDKTVPEIRREISKVEIDSAQLSSDQNILKEEDHNMAKTIQALAVSISTLQNERSTQRNLDSEVNKLKMEIEILKAAAALNSHNKVSRDGCKFKLSVNVSWGKVWTALKTWVNTIRFSEGLRVSWTLKLFSKAFSTNLDGFSLIEFVELDSPKIWTSLTIS